MKTEKRKKCISIVLTMLFTFVGAFQIKGYSALGTSEGPELLITEVLPMSDAVSDSYEYIELYNSSDNNIDLKNYKLPLQNIDITSSKIIPSKSALVVCMSSSSTLRNFNSFYGTSLTEDKFLSLSIVGGILKNSASDTLILAKDDGTVISRASYELKDFETKKSVTYKYPLSGFDMTILGQKQVPTPGTISINQLPASGVAVTGISLDRTLVTMEMNQTAQLYATVIPATASNKNVTWESGNSSIVQVNQNGLITAKAEGAALITAKTYDGGFIATCTVIVKKVPVTGVTLDKSKLSLDIGKAAILKASITPEDATNKSVEWFSSNANIATVDSNGVVIGKSQGSTLITVRTKDGNFISTCIVEVSGIAANVPVTGISLNKTNITLEKGTSLILEPEIRPSSATNKQLTWSSSNSYIASVDSYGIISAKNSGTAVITARTKDGGYTASCTVHVVENGNLTIPVTGITLNKYSLSIKTGSTEKLIPTVLPSNATNKSVVWSSDNSTVATVDTQGKITALKPGIALITVTTVDGSFTARSCVIVEEDDDDDNPSAVTGIRLNKTSVSIKEGKFKQLTPIFTPGNVKNKSVTWKTSNANIAIVTTSGRVIGLKEGIATITVTTADGKYSSKCTVVVSKNKDHGKEKDKNKIK